ncbi:PRC-barrel domain-containing protein [Zobellella sp. DQSA1]|uniref:PRC-barrel domain-containing protein n=1 Tax=Zobellella sp. DQSA1 TaxID=3342386 RepID=UPI0035C0974C
MKRQFQTTLLAAAMASVMALPGWAADTTDPEPVQMTDPQLGTGSDDLTPMEPAQAPAEQSPEMDSEEPQLVSGDNPVYDLTPAELKQMDVVDPTGHKVGKVTAIVRSKEDANIQVVISSGGILGIGAKEVAVLVDELELNEDRLQIGSSQEELETREDYTPESFIELEPADRSLSELSAFESIPEEPPVEDPMTQSEEARPGEPPMTQPPEGAPDSGDSY